MDFKQVYAINVNDWTEEKNKLTYLSWAHAWRAFAEIYPNATYEVKKNTDGIPCFGNNKLGYMVYTSVTVEELTHEMWLPVMDFKNKAILEPSMFDVNKTVMRCLTKNLAMFGLGLYIYAGEDLPNETDDTKPPVKPQQANTPKPTQNTTPPVKPTTEQLNTLYELALKKGSNKETVNAACISKFKLKSIEDLTLAQVEAVTHIYKAKEDVK